MGKLGKGASGAMSGAATGAQMGGPWGALGGAALGYVLGENTGGAAPQQVQQVDPAFINSLHAQAMGTEKTAADLKMKAAFDQNLAQQVAAARAARGVNPALLQRNVARVAAEQGAKAVGMTAEANLQNQDTARMRYLQAMQLNQNAQRINAESAANAEARDQKQLGSLMNSFGAIGATMATAQKEKKNDANTTTDNTVTDSINTSGLTLQDTPSDIVNRARQFNTEITLGANQNVNVPQYDENAFKPPVQPSDERQKDLIKNETLPQNGNMAMQNQQAVQPQGATTPPMAAFAPPQAPAAPQAPVAAPVTSPAPVPASQTALGQANASMAKGGRVDDLQMQQMSMPEVANGPSQAEIQEMLADAQRRETRNWDNSVNQSADDNYAANLQRWYAKQAADREAYAKQKGEVAQQNMQVDAERQARLSKFYTGNSNANANDIASRYVPKEILNNTNFHSAQSQQAALGIGNQTPGAMNFANNRAGQIVASIGTGGVTGPLMGLSDERSKEGISPENKSGADFNPKSFLDKLNAYSFEYKQGFKDNSNAGDGRRLGVMAQQLEQAGPVGKSMVENGPDGVKRVNYATGFGAILAAQAQLNERLNAIEAKKNKKG